MILGSPQFLLLIPLLLIVGWFARRLALWKPLRVLWLLLIVLLLCDPLIQLKKGGIDLWVLVDRSSSAEDLVAPNVGEWRNLLEKSKPGQKDRLHFVDYAAEVVPTANSETAIYPGNREETRTNLAIRNTLARMEPDRHHRILLFSDGYSTEPLSGLPEKLLQQGVPLDYRLLRAEEANDYQISRLSLPERVQSGEPYVVDISISGKPDGDVPLTVIRNGQELLTRTVKVTGGQGRFRFTDRVVSPAAYQYTARINPEPDAFPGNNDFDRWIEVVSGPRVLLLTAYTDDPLVPILQAQGFQVDVVTDTVNLNPGRLTGAKAVILNNVPAYEIPNNFLESLEFFVTAQGGGMLMAGGQRSFGSGGYYESAVDPLLPVSMELKTEHRKLAVAMAIVMDRSGSMAMTTASGHSKMQLANEGAARAVELLGDPDAVTIFAVDSQAHKITGLTNVGKSRGQVIERVRRVESMGGGIFVYTGLQAAWEELKKSNLGQRHIILFTDANDSEEPGEYQALIKEMRAAEATISVIGLGTKADTDAAFLEDIAKRGEGRMFFTQQAGELPNIFAQETVTVARSSFIDDATGTQPTGRWYEIARRDLGWLEAVGGYNLSYLREGDETALVSSDTYAAPLVAFGRRGIGKTAAVSFPLGGDFSEQTRNWEKVGDFVQTLTRWLMGDAVPPGVGIRHRTEGSRLSIDLIYDSDEWAEKFSREPPRILLQRGYQTGATEELVWERLAPGHYSTFTSLKATEPVRGAVQIGGAALPFGPVSIGSDVEWQFDPVRISELRETATTSGGEEIVDLTTAWRKPPSPEFESIRAWLASAALILFLLEAFVTRAGWRMPLPSAITERRAKEKPAKEKAKKEPKPEEPAPEPTKKADPEPSPAEKPSRKSRFARAKKRR